MKQTAIWRLPTYHVSVLPRYVPDLVARLRGATEKPIAVYPNSGETWDPAGKRWLDRDQPVDFAAAAVAWYRAGARLVGGCCRTGPRDVREIRACLLDPGRSQEY